MPPTSALSKMIKILPLLDNYMSIKADVYTMEETNEVPCWSKRPTFTLQSNLGYEYETNKFVFIKVYY